MEGTEGREVKGRSRGKECASLFLNTYRHPWYLQVATLAVWCSKLQLPAAPHPLLIYCYALLISSMNVNVKCEFLW